MISQVESGGGEDSYFAIPLLGNSVLCPAAFPWLKFHHPVVLTHTLLSLWIFYTFTLKILCFPMFELVLYG